MWANIRIASFSIALAVLPACASHELPAASAMPAQNLSLNGFEDAIQHWKNAHGDDYPRYRPEQVREIADNIVLLQRDHGGWIQNQDPQRILDAGERQKTIAAKSDPLGSFDNRNVYTQIAYLMGAYERIGNASYKEAALRGLDYLLAHQIKSCGGWPHTDPASAPYHPMITVADEVFSGPLTLLRNISESQWPYASLDEATRARATNALDRGEACLLKLQVLQNGTPTGWAGQYDPYTLAPAMGRTFELPSIATEESVYVLRYLMSVDDPKPEIIASIEGGTSWLRAVSIKDTRLEEVQLPEPVRFKYHEATHDRRLVRDADAPLLWARFYDISDNTTILANRDSQRVDTYQDISMERRTGYHWFGTWANALLENDYPAWRCRVYQETSCSE